MDVEEDDGKKPEDERTCSDWQATGNGCRILSLQHLLPCLRLCCLRCCIKRDPRSRRGAEEKKFSREASQGREEKEGRRAKDYERERERDANRTNCVLYCFSFSLSHAFHAVSQSVFKVSRRSPLLADRRVSWLRLPPLACYLARSLAGDSLARENCSRERERERKNGRKKHNDDDNSVEREKMRVKMLKKSEERREITCSSSSSGRERERERDRKPAAQEKRRG